MTKATHVEFLTWAQEHAAVFGMIRPEEKQAISFWEATLVSNGYSLGELRYATQVLLDADSPHLHGFLGFISGPSRAFAGSQGP